jgi:hypothetical protein
LWDIGILSTEILELLSVSCLNVLGKSWGERIAGLGVTGNNGLSQRNDGAGLANPKK